MIYVDSSVLVKRYLEERGSKELNAKILKSSGQSHRLLTSVFSFAEVHAAFARKLQERPLLRATEYHWATNRFESDWRACLTRVELTQDILDLIPDIAKRHFLKGADAVQLASALWVHQRLELDKISQPLLDPFIFSTSDQQLARAAEYEQLEVFDPEHP